MRAALREMAGRALRAAGLVAAARRRTATQDRILMYHGVGTAGGNNEVSVEVLEEQLTHLLEHYTPVPLANLLFGAPPVSAGGRPRVAITFDDGQVGTYTRAFPLLQALGVPATIFVVVDLLKDGGPVWTGEVNLLLQRMQGGTHRIAAAGGWTLDLSVEARRAQAQRELKDWMKGLTLAERDAAREELRALAGGEVSCESERTIDWDMARNLSRSGLVAIESHSESHPILPLVDDETLARELRDSRETLRKELGVAAEILCYPNGSHDQRVVEAAMAAGYRAAVTTLPGLVSPSADPFRLPRIGVYRSTGREVFRAKLAGLVGGG